MPVRAFIDTAEDENIIGITRRIGYAKNGSFLLVLLDTWLSVWVFFDIPGRRVERVLGVHSTAMTQLHTVVPSARTSKANNVAILRESAIASYRKFG